MRAVSWSGADWQPAHLSSNQLSSLQRQPAWQQERQPAPERHLQAWPPAPLAAAPPGLRGPQTAPGRPRPCCRPGGRLPQSGLAVGRVLASGGGRRRRRGSAAAAGASEHRIMLPATPPTSETLLGLRRERLRAGRTAEFSRWEGLGTPAAMHGTHGSSPNCLFSAEASKCPCHGPARPVAHLEGEGLAAGELYGSQQADGAWSSVLGRRAERRQRACRSALRRLRLPGAGRCSQQRR